MARPKDKEDIILTNAADIFWQKGYAKAAVKDIADASGIAKGTVYDYFSSKDELFVAVLRHQTGLINARIEEELSQRFTFIEKVHAILDFVFSEEMTQGILWMHTMMTRDGVGLNGSMREALESFFQDQKRIASGTWRHILEKGLEEGCIEVEDIDFVAHLLLTITSAYHMQMKDFIAPDYRSLMLDFLLKGLKYRELPK